MNKAGVAILSGTLFSGVGFVIGWFVSKKVLTNLHEKEIKSFKDKQKEHDEWLLNFYGVKREAAQNELEHKELEESKGFDVGLANNDVTVANTIIKNEGYTPIDSTEFNPKESHIYEITEEEFSESENDFESLNYYSKDKVIADREDNYISNYVDLIGPEEIWNKFNRGVTSVYIRNEINGMDYEILLNNDFWSSNASASQKAVALNVGYGK